MIESSLLKSHKNKNGANNYSFSEDAYNAGTCGFGYNLTENNEIPQGDPKYDAARANMGEPWMMPTHTQVLELRHRDNTTSEWTSLNGVNGRKFTNKKDSSKYIFLPDSSSDSQRTLNNYNLDFFLNFPGH